VLFRLGGEQRLGHGRTSTSGSLIGPPAGHTLTYGRGNSTRANRARSATGDLTFKGCIAERGHNRAKCAKTAHGLSSARSVTVSPDGTSVYALGENAIVRFKRNLASGALTPRGCIGAAFHPSRCAKTARGLYRLYAVAVSSDGKSVYVKVSRTSPASSDTPQAAPSPTRAASAHAAETPACAAARPARVLTASATWR